MTTPQKNFNVAGFAHELVLLAEKVEPNPVPPPEFLEERIHWSMGDKPIIGDEQLAAFAKLVDQAAGEIGKVSRVDIERELSHLLTEVIQQAPADRHKFASDEIDKLIQARRAAMQTFVVGVPVEGLWLEGNWPPQDVTKTPIPQIGPVTFRGIDKATLDGLEGTSQLLTVARQQDDWLFRDVTAIATISVTAGDRDAAHAVALEQVGLALDLLRVTFSMLTFRFPGLGTTGASLMNFKWFLEGEYRPDLSPDQNAHPVSVSVSNRLALMLEPYLWQLIRQWRIQQRSKAVFADDELGTRLRHAVSWSGRAYSQSHQETAAIQYTVAIEGLLGPGNTSQLRERTAFLLGRNAEQRKAIYKDLEGLFSDRGFVVHRIGQVSDTTVARLADYVRRAALTVMERVEAGETWAQIEASFDTARWETKQDT